MKNWPHAERVNNHREVRLLREGSAEAEAWEGGGDGDMWLC